MPTIVKFNCVAATEAGTLDYWRRQLPDAAPEWAGCRFVFDPGARDYDWLVTYDCLPRVGTKLKGWREELACPAANTILVTSEPSSIKIYDRAFLRQFAYVLTGHEPWSIDQTGVIRSQPGLRWFYGMGSLRQKTWSAMNVEERPEKPKTIGTVCSAKQQAHTMHRQRYNFTQRLKHDLPELEIFGRGVQAIDDKAEAVDPFRLHLAIENHRCDHWWTEKLADAFLGWSLPVYCGCTNLEQYFPADSFIAIDINNYEAARDRIRRAILDDEYAQHLDAIAEARRRVLYEYNLFAVIARIVDDANRPRPNPASQRVLRSRHEVRYRNPLNLATYLWRTSNRYRRGRLQTLPK